MTPAPSLQQVISQAEADAASPAPLDRLKAAADLTREMAEAGDAALGYFVDQARRAGHSWSDIGDALGVTKQAAQQRHTRLQFQGATLERFTPRARHALEAAQPAARALGHNYVGTEHLLLGLFSEPDGIAGQILTEAGLGEEAVQVAVAERVGPGPAPGSPSDKLPFAPRASSALSAALNAALELGHNYIGTEHLLIGLVRSPGVGAELLVTAGLDAGTVSERVTAKLVTYMAKRNPAS